MLFGILGLGSIGDRHARNLMNLGHQVIFHDPNILGSIPQDEVLKHSDAILICTPTQQHAHDLLLALNAGKHVLVEKPIGYDCPSYISGLLVGSRMRYPNQVVATGFMCRFHPLVRIVKGALKGERFGKLRSAEFHVLQRNTKPEYMRDGVIRNWMSHEIDLARYLFGNLYVESATAMDNNGQDVAAVIHCAGMDADELPITIVGDYLTSPFQRKIVISGDKKTETYNLEMTGGTPDSVSKIWDQTYIDEMKAFINRIDGKDFGPLADGSDGVAALEIVMQAREKAGLK